MKLLADAMLGRLAKWLRILGYDTEYLADTDDYAVMRLARAEGRLILTRDRALAARPELRTLLVESESLEEQLLQIREALGPPPEPAATRCSLCNRVLLDAPPELVKAQVPPYVRRTHDQFSVCPECGRVFWQGTHWAQMEALIAGLHDEPGSDKINDTE
jgi:uncharacterized protein with PIN domain